MKKTLIFSLFLLSISVSAQKVDLDRFYFDVNYQILPKIPVPFEKRTFTSTVNLGGRIQTYTNSSAMNEKVKIYGWKKTEDNPTVKIELNIEDFVERNVSQEISVDELKDKDGKVISRKEYYYVIANYSGVAHAKIVGPRAPVILTEKQIEEEKAKQAAASSNRFLKNAVVKKDTVASNNGFRFNLSSDLSYKSKEFPTPSAAIKDFYLNKNAIFDEKLRDFAEGSMKDFNNRINNSYGFTPESRSEILWILDAKNEEGKTQIEAIQAVKELFKTMKPNEPIEDLRTNMQPLIEYFESLKTKYPDDNKPSRKMRYSAYYNLAMIYLMLDQPERTIIEAQKLIENDYDKSDGKVFIERANRLMDDFKKANTRSTHNPPLK